MSNRTFYSPLRLETVRRYISMWKTDLKKELCVLTMFCIQKKVVQIPCVNHFVLEKLVTSLTSELVIHVWMRTSLI